jgi:hypothetical protein
VDAKRPDSHRIPWPGTAHPSGGERVRLAMPLVGATVFLPWALYWGLLIP